MKIVCESKEKIRHHNKFMKVHAEEIYKNEKKIEELIANNDNVDDHEIKDLIECNSRHKIEEDNHRQKGLQEEDEVRKKIEGLNKQKKDLHKNILILTDLLAQLNLAQSTIQAISLNDESGSDSDSDEKIDSFEKNKQTSNAEFSRKNSDRKIQVAEMPGK